MANAVRVTDAFDVKLSCKFKEARIMVQTNHSYCTTILVGKNASYDGSTIIARNEDAGTAVNPKKFVVVQPEDQPQTYHAKLSGFNNQLPDNPQRYTAVPDATDDQGIWGEAGVNAQNVAMSATETITTNPRILGADPLVKNGFGEEDLLTITLPYIDSARSGVKRVGELLEKYGTYESNGIIFSDVNEIWYMETAGGHHWVAERIPDDAYVIAPNQTGIQEVDFNDPAHFMYSKDLKAFVSAHHLNLGNGFNFRNIFGSNTQLDRHYNTPRAWFGQRYFNPDSVEDKSPMSNDLPFIAHANRKMTIEDLKYVLSSHYQDTPYDPFTPGTDSEKMPFRPIGFNRNQELSIIQLRPNVPSEYSAIQWLAFASNVANTLTPFYANVDVAPDSYRNTTKLVDSQNAYWVNRLISLISADHFHTVMDDVEAYQQRMMGYAHQRIIETDAAANGLTGQQLSAKLQAANDETSDHIIDATRQLLTTILTKASNGARGSFTRGHY
ncbi:putative dipeptidase A [Lentilactobacillus parafarraginis F0439]|uniref:Dipeptidase n=2 Tax=Lentilactobacillus parafarraginis TaxID=390842 RepID=G9ZSC4_9LACO|nr:putative dipeptidase A [Lentilactobacillus parafarraginis F0439]